MATTPNRNYTVVDSSPEKAHDLIPQFRDFQVEVDADVQAVADAAGAAPLTTKGDLFGFSTVVARVPIGTNGQVLTADSTQALGLKWDNPAGGGDALTASPLSQFASTTSAQLASVLSDESGTSGGFVRSGGAALSGLTGLGIRSTGAAFDLTIATSEVLTAGRTLSIVLNDAARTLTISGNATVSGTNTGDQTSVSGNAGTATALQTARTIGGVSFDGTANITVATATGGFTVSGGALALGINDLTMTGSLGTTGARLTKGWFTDLQVTNAIAGSITGNAATVTTNANLTGPITSAGNATSIASQTGTGTKFVMDTSPTLVTPLLGTPTSGTLTNCTGLPIGTGVSGLGSGVATFLATPSSANLAAAVTGGTGSGALVFGTSPTFTTDITSPVYKGQGTVSATGDIRGQNGFAVMVRNQAGTADITLAGHSNGVTSIGTGTGGTYVDVPALRVSQYTAPGSTSVGINSRIIGSANGNMSGAWITGEDDSTSGTTALVDGAEIVGHGGTGGQTITLLNGASIAANTNSGTTVGSMRAGVFSCDPKGPISSTMRAVRASFATSISVTAPLATVFTGIATNGSGCTLTDVRGLDLSGWANAGTVTTSYGIYMDSSIDVGTTKYAIYSLSTSQSLLSGGLEVTGKLLVSGSRTTTTANTGVAFHVTTTITNNTGSGQSSLWIRNTFNGDGNIPAGFDILPTFAPSASIALARGGAFGAWGNPASGITITDLMGANSVLVYGSVAGAVTNGTTIQVDSPLVLGALKPTSQYGLKVKNQGVAGMTNAIGLQIDAQTGATNNYDMGFGTVDTTAAGAYYGRIPVLYNGLKKYIHVFSA